MALKQMPWWKTRWFSVGVGSLVSLIFLYLALKDVPLDQVANLLARADYTWVLLAILAMVIQSGLRTVRWIDLFYPVNRGLHVPQMLAIVFISQMLNIVSPWRVGDVARIYLAGEVVKRSKAQTLVTLGTEKVFDTLMLLILLLGIPLFITLPAWLEESRAGLILVTIVLFAAVAALLFAGERLLNLLRIIPLPWFRHLLDTHGAVALSGLDVFKRWDLHIKLQFFSLVIWLLGVLVNYFTLLALGLQGLPLVTSFLLLAVLQVGGVVPSSPGKVGVFQALCIVALGLFGVDKGLGLTYGILLYLIAYGTPIAIGILCLWWGGVNLSRIAASEAGGVQ